MNLTLETRTRALSSNGKLRSANERKRTSARLPLMAAIGGICGIASGAVSAVEIGEINVQSQLGQPLRASISYALNANEQIHEYCIFLRSGAPGDGIPMLTQARIRIVDNAIVLTGRTPVSEPILAMQLEVNCPYTPRLSRNFTLLVNPLEGGVERALANVTPSESGIVPRAETNPRPVMPVSDIRPAVDRAPVTSSTRYQVQPGDTLSGIALRIDGRTGPLMMTVDAIFAANPEAFIDGDKNLVKAGSWLNIPDSTGVMLAESNEVLVDGAYPSYEDSTSEYFAEDSEATADSMDAYTGFAAAAPTDADSASVATGIVADTSTAEPVSEAPMFPDEEYGDLIPAEDYAGGESAEAAPTAAVDEVRPGDVFASDQSPFPTGDETASAPPRQSIPVVSSAPGNARGSSWTWLIWAGGAGLGFVLGLALFSRRIRERFGGTPAQVAQPAAGTFENTSIDLAASQIAVPDVDFQFDDPPVNQPEITLDADLSDGSGLQGSSDIDVAQDFGFSADSDLGAEMDLELPAVSAQDEEQPSTDIIPPHLIEESSILKSEIPPSDVDTEYDLSMIVDATKQGIDETLQTARDLMAVQVDPAASEDAAAASYSRNQEVDFEALEQDYEEELTATQALNAEILKAAVEVAEQMDNPTTADIDSDSPTGSFAEIPLEMSAELPSALDDDITAELTANVTALDDAVNDELGDAAATEIADLDATEVADLDDTTINEALPEEMRAVTLEPTVEMDVEGGRIDTKKTAS